jgi:hypothetical protein
VLAMKVQDSPMHHHGDAALLRQGRRPLFTSH